MADLTTMTPVEIDTELAEINTRYYAKMRDMHLSRRYLEAAQANRATALQRGRADLVAYDDRDIAHYKAKVEEQLKAAMDISKEGAPHHAEFKRRGGWFRAWLVDNASGHIHSSTECTTCYPTTEFVWLPEYSGRTEAELIADARSMACTICFPNAPVDTRPGLIEAPARKAARLVREAEKAVRDAAKKAKGITNPDGSELLVPTELRIRRGETEGYPVKAERTAEIMAVDALVTEKVVQDGHLSPGRGIREGLEAEDRNVAEVQLGLLLPALAHKRGITESALRESLA
ncbi:MAG TPA: hypothetical protein VF885_02915, partial [Arthrobacter sp.]